MIRVKIKLDEGDEQVLDFYAEWVEVSDATGDGMRLRPDGDVIKLDTAPM